MSRFDEMSREQLEAALEHHEKAQKLRSQSTNCNDCSRDWPDWYAVTYAVWAEAVPDYEDLRKTRGRVLLCLGCLEARLKRPLVLEDFPVYPVNRPIRWLLARGQ